MSMPLSCLYHVDLTVKCFTIYCNNFRTWNLNLKWNATHRQCRAIKRGETWALFRGHWRPVVLLRCESFIEVWLHMIEVHLEEHYGNPAWKWQGPGQEIEQHAPLRRAWSTWYCGVQLCIELSLHCGLWRPTDILKIPPENNIGYTKSPYQRKHKHF